MIFLYYVEIVIYSLIMIIYVLSSTNISILNVILQVIKSLLINSIYFTIMYLVFIGIICLIKNRKKKITY